MTKILCAVAAVVILSTPVLAADADWQPVLTKVLKSEGPGTPILCGVVVNHNTGCVFCNLGERGIYCSSAGARSFNRISDQDAAGRDREFARALKEGKDSQHVRVSGKDAKHLFQLTKAGIAESIDGGTTWSGPIALPKGLKSASGLSWMEYDPRNDILYVMKTGSDLYKLARRK